ncbi:MAG: hypothetical protein WC908_01855 [Candidatus Paceibacterota bacterium]
MIQAVALLAELFFGDLMTEEQPTVEKYPNFTNRRGEELSLEDIIDGRVVTIAEITYLFKKPAKGFWNYIGIKKRSKRGITQKIKDDKIEVSFHVNNNSLKISIGSKGALPKLHRNYDKGTICMKYFKEDGFYWHIYLPRSSFVPIDWI